MELNFYFTLFDIWDARKIYMKDGLYNSEIRQSLKEVIKQNKELYHH